MSYDHKILISLFNEFSKLGFPKITTEEAKTEGPSISQKHKTQACLPASCLDCSEPLPLSRIKIRRPSTDNGPPITKGTFKSCPKIKALSYITLPKNKLPQTKRQNPKGKIHVREPQNLTPEDQQMSLQEHKRFDCQGQKSII